MSGTEVRVSPDGERVAILFTNSMRYYIRRGGEYTGHHWRALSWPDTSDLKMEALTDEDVADWQVVYYSEGVSTT